MENPVRMPSPTSLLDGFQSLMTPDVVSRASFSFGESESAIRKGWSALAPTVFGAVANRADDHSFMSRVFDMIKNPATDTSILNNVSSYVGSVALGPQDTGLGGRFMSMLFGRNINSVGNVLSGLAGIKTSTASSMLAMAGPLVLAYLGSAARVGRLDASGLSNMLLGERSYIKSAIPEGLSSLTDVAGGIGSTVSTATETMKRNSGWRWIIAATIGLLLIWGLSSVVGRRTVPTAKGVVDAAKGAVNFVSRSLPTGINLQFLPTGIEGKLISFIEDPTQAASKGSWFDFDRLLFETNSAVLKTDSNAQLQNIAEILRAYPQVNAKVGGYTDNSGDPTANLQLSQDRANSVRQALIGLGVSPDRLTAEGYGEQHPVASNSTEVGRAQNRRVALLVTTK
jgi:outer membrane protein OmpA-like peptidoglycan-associated protein